MLNKRISADLTQESEDNVLQNIQGAKDLLPFLVELTKDERIRVSKLGRKNTDFVDRGLRYALANPQFVPSYLDMVEFQKDVTLRSQLYKIYDEINLLEKNLKDTLTVLEAEAYEAARIFYAAVKGAAKNGEKGAEVIAKDMYFHYKRQRSKTEEKQDTETPPATETTKAKAA
jgi:hypothetical protein